LRDGSGAVWQPGESA